MEKTTVKITAIKKTIHTLLDSADSHVDFIDYPALTPKAKEEVGGGEFHKKCIIDYCKRVIELLT